MIRIHLSGYTQSDKDALEITLLRGISFVANSCDGDCDNCRYKTVCADLHNSLEWLEKQVVKD